MESSFIRREISRKSLDKEKPKETDRPKEQSKQPSNFDQLLEQNRKLQQNAVSKQLNLRESDRKGSEKALERVKEEYKDRNRRDEKHEEKGKEEDRQTKSESKEGHKRVATKEDLKRDSGGSGGKKEGGAFSFHKKEGIKTTRQTHLTETQLEAQKNSFLKAFQEKLNQTSSTFPKKFDQETLNHLVRYVRIIRNKGVGAEMELDLNAQTFKGLRLRLTSQDGKITLHFMTKGEEVRDLFTREKGRITDELKNKGIKITDIKVT